MTQKVTWEDQTWDVEYEELATGIYVYHNAIPVDWGIPDRVENALAIPHTRFKWNEATLNFGHVDDTHRWCKDFKIREDLLGPKDRFSEDMHKLHNQVITSLKQILTHYCSENYLKGIEYIECINIVRYGSGQFFKVHSDDGEPYRCTVSAVGYPNDNYEGGELWFPKFNVKYKPKAGDFVLCPSAFVYAHSSEPVTDDGIKYALVIMTDRNEFAHRKDSPTYYTPEQREPYMGK